MEQLKIITGAELNALIEYTGGASIFWKESIRTLLDGEEHSDDEFKELLKESFPTDRHQVDTIFKFRDWSICYDDDGTPCENDTSYHTAWLSLYSPDDVETRFEQRVCPAFGFEWSNEDTFLLELSELPEIVVEPEKPINTLQEISYGLHHICYLNVTTGEALRRFYKSAGVTTAEMFKVEIKTVYFKEEFYGRGIADIETPKQ